MEWHLDKTYLVESTQTSLVRKSGHFQIHAWLKACLPHALTQLSPNLEKYAAEAEWTDCSSPECTNTQLMECASHGSFQPGPGPGPFPASTQLLRTADCSCLSCWKWALNSPEQVTNLHLQCQKANRSLSSICAMQISPSTSLCRPQLKYISKTHSKAKHLKCKPSLPPGSGPFSPKMHIGLSLSLCRPEPVTSTVGGF